MYKKQSGFTVLELLVVILIIGLLAGVIVASISGARKKASLNAFKAETSSVYRTWAATCVSGNINLPANTNVTQWGGLVSSCGLNGNNTFSIQAQAVYDSSCNVIINQDTITFSGACN